MLILLCGLSRGGKTTLIKRAELTRLGVQHISASQILREADQPLDVKDLDAIRFNQKRLITALKERNLVGINSLTLLDGHLLLETSAGPKLIPLDTLNELPLSGLIFVRTDPEIVSQRRAGSPSSTNIHEILRLTEMERQHALKLASERRIPLHEIDSSEPASLEGAILSLIGGRRAEAFR